MFDASILACTIPSSCRKSTASTKATQICPTNQPGIRPWSLLLASPNCAMVGPKTGRRQTNDVAVEAVN